MNEFRRHPTCFNFRRRNLSSVCRRQSPCVIGLVILLKPLLFMTTFGVAGTTEVSVAVFERYACFNSVFEISCDENEMLVFDSVRYGRNDTHVAARCEVPYSWNCDIDVHFPLNRACAGKRHCSLDVSVTLFTDPCGYDEFLRVSYRCVPVFNVQSGCPGLQGPVLYDHAYISSPNYPDKYYMDAVCRWSISVQKWQTIRITVFDLELDVKRGGQCHDFLEITANSKEYFKECGALGKQVIDIPTSVATVSFTAGQTSLTQRGFFLHFEAVGPGCPDLPELNHGWIVYYIEEEVLYANATCDNGFRFVSMDRSFRQIRCNGYYWNSYIPECEMLPPTTSPAIASWSRLPSASYPTAYGNRSTVSMSIQYGIALSLVSSILVITLMSLLAIYCYKRRRSHHIQLDKWRVVINNLQENQYSNGKVHSLESATPPMSCHLSNDCCNVRRAAAATASLKQQLLQKNSCGTLQLLREDDWQGRNLLASRDFSDEDDVTAESGPFSSSHLQQYRATTNTGVGRHELVLMTPVKSNSGASACQQNDRNINSSYCYKCNSQAKLCLNTATGPGYAGSIGKTYAVHRGSMPSPFDRFPVPPATGYVEESCRTFSRDAMLRAAANSYRNRTYRRVGMPAAATVRSATLNRPVNRPTRARCSLYRSLSNSAPDLVECLATHSSPSRKGFHNPARTDTFEHRSGVDCTGMGCGVNASSPHDVLPPQQGRVAIEDCKSKLARSTTFASSFGSCGAGSQLSSGRSLLSPVSPPPPPRETKVW